VRRLDQKPRGGVPSFGPTSGAISGVVGVLCGVAFAASTLTHGLEASELRYLFGGLAFAAAAWAVLLRPRVRLLSDHVELRNGFSEFLVPYAAISEVAIRSFTVVHVDGKRYIGLAVGRNRKSMTRRRKDEVLRDRPDLAAGKSLEKASEADLLQVTLEDRIDRAAGGPAVAVRRHWALPEIAVLAACLAGFVICLFVG
jgi:hypothetical protein